MRRLASLLLFILFASPAAADLHLVEQRESHAENTGQASPVERSEVSIWFGEDRMRVDLPGQTMIVRLDEKTLSVLLPDARQVAVASLPIRLDDLVPEGLRPIVLPMLRRARVTLSVTPGEQTREIDGRSCRRYDLLTRAANAEVRSVVWASEEIPLPARAAEMLSLTMFALQEDISGLAGELGKIRGYRVLQETETKMLGSTVHTTERLVKAEQSEPPEGNYDAPADYKRVKLSLETLSRGGAPR